MSDSDNTGGFKRTKEDIAHALTKAGLSSVPFVGGAAAELMSLVWEPALSRRRDAWLRGLAENLQTLEEKVEGFRIDKLSENETFITASLQASQSAIQNHQKEKLDALRNAVLNSALDVNLNEEIQLLSLSLIERLTVSHIKLLKFFNLKGQNVTIIANDNVSDSIARQVHWSFTKKDYYSLSEKDRKNWRHQDDQEVELIRVLVEDLSNLGFIDIKDSSSSSEHFDHYSIRMTIFGKQFINFISTPDPLTEQEESS